MKLSKIVFISVGLALAALALMFWLLWELSSNLDNVRLSIWAILATLALPLVFGIGFWVGKVEYRGFLSGVDAGLDKIARAVDMRDNSRIKVQASSRTEPPQFVVLPGADYPKITHRATESGEVIDL